MNNSLLWRGLLILAIVAGAALVAFPLDEKVNLGLDLRGGMHLVLSVKTEDALRSETDKDMEALISSLEDEDITGVEGLQTADNKFTLTGVSSDSDDVVRKTVRDRYTGWSVRRVGEQLELTRGEAGNAQIVDGAIRQAENTIRNRIDQFGVAEPVIHRELGSNRIVVQLPGVDDPERVKEVIGKTAFLEFRLADWPTEGFGAASREEVLAHYGGRLPDRVELFEQDIRDEEGQLVETRYWGLEAQRVITGRDLRDARPSRGQFQEAVVAFTLKADAAKRFGEITGANVGRSLAIVLDGKLQSAPTINDRISDSGIIQGRYTSEEVQDLVTTLKSGALPAEISYLEERTVGPWLGRDSIERGLRAGAIGAGLVVLAMLVVYKFTGINAVIALLLDFVLVFGALAYMGATLTLPGIAGIILTIGMAVDANVLVFERIREELRNGRTVRSAVQSGFSKAFSSILDANVTTVIAALFLFQFGSGPIRGFAITLVVGIFASVFTAVFVSRWLFDLFLSRRARVEKLSI